MTLYDFRPRAIRLVGLFAALASASISPAGAQTKTILHTFGSIATDGAGPEAQLTLGADGFLYGTTQSSNTEFWSSIGTIFRYNPSTGQYATLQTIVDGINNIAPTQISSLTLGTDGKFYGTTQGNGRPGFGTLFSFDPSTNAVTILHAFGDGSVTNDGAIPGSPVIQGSDGKLYGTTVHGGSQNLGSLYSYDLITDQLTILHSFADGTVAHDGTLPFGGVVEGSGGVLYGTTANGGLADDGTLYAYNLSTGNETVLHQFPDVAVSNDGQDPIASVTLAADGTLYGTTVEGGANGDGTIFHYNPTGSVYTSAVSFSIAPPSSTDHLIQGIDGNLHGVSTFGGVNSRGSLFEYNVATGGLTTAYSFQQPGDGYFPIGGLLQLSDGTFYGTTFQGGSTDFGTLFKFGAAQLELIVVSPHDVTGGISSFVTVTLTHPAPAGGADVKLSTSSSAATFTSTSVIIPTGQTTAKVNLFTVPVGVTTSVVLTAKYGDSHTCHITVLVPKAASLQVLPTKVVGGLTATGTLNLTGVTAVDTPVDVTFNNGSASVTTPVVVPANELRVNFTINTTPVAANTIVKATATVNGVSELASFTVKP